ncbi:hypothetical protein LXL04_007500 [Taraxacum kok-saghyz]
MYEVVSWLYGEDVVEVWGRSENVRVFPATSTVVARWSPAATVVAGGGARKREGESSDFIDTNFLFIVNVARLIDILHIIGFVYNHKMQQNRPGRNKAEEETHDVEGGPGDLGQISGAVESRNRVECRAVDRWSTQRDGAAVQGNHHRLYQYTDMKLRRYLTLQNRNGDMFQHNDSCSLIESAITSGTGKENPAALLSIFPDPVVLLLFSGEALLSVVLLSIFSDPEKLFFPDLATTLSRRASLSRFSALAVVILPLSRSGELLFPDSQRRFLNLSIFWISVAPFSACASFLVLIPTSDPGYRFLAKKFRIPEIDQDSAEEEGFRKEDHPRNPFKAAKWQTYNFN